MHLMLKFLLIKKMEIYILFFKNDTCNINEKNIDKIFDKFFTVSNSRTEKNSGLGLTITKELVQKMNGKILQIIMIKR